jgi:predicted nucleotide-binding protein (sugar kinase/HSP70/actin superfamily)
VIRSIETGSGNLSEVITAAGKDFEKIPLLNIPRKPVIAIVGETFMRDNPSCSGYLVDKLEELGAETLMAPFGEWLIYSSYRYWRDSIWKSDLKGLFRSRLQSIAQHYTENKLRSGVSGIIDIERDIELKDMIRLSAPYVHKDYDGDPVIAIGSASKLAETKISGIVYIMPFTCMPGTLVASLTTDFRKDHNNIPWENIAYDGQQDTTLDIRLQAFMHQAREYHVQNPVNQE